MLCLSGLELYSRWVPLRVNRTELCMEPVRLFPVFISPIVWNICENLHYESVYFKQLHNELECY